MTSLVSVAVALAIAAVMIGIFVVLKLKFKNRVLPTFLKPFAAILFVGAFLRHIYMQTAVYYVKGLDHPSSPFNVDGPNPELTAFAIILVWFSYAAMLTTVLSTFFNFKTLSSKSKCNFMAKCRIIRTYYCNRQKSCFQIFTAI